MPHVMEHRSFHADHTIRECALVIIYVPIVKRCKNDQESYENSYLIPLSQFV
jgi:hypothetical protein